MCKKTERKIYSNLLSFRVYESTGDVMENSCVILTRRFSIRTVQQFFYRVRSMSIIYRRYVVTYITSFRSENTLNILNLVKRIIYEQI